jgi:hypothetical protein
MPLNKNKLFRYLSNSFLMNEINERTIIMDHCIKNSLQQSLTRTKNEKAYLIKTKSIFYFFLVNKYYFCYYY